MIDVKTYLNGVKKKKVSVTKTIKAVIEEAKSINKKHNYFNLITEELALEQAKKIDKNPKGKLAGLPITIKDSICVKNIESTAGSYILTDYKPVFNATAVQKLVDEGAIILGKTAQDEFGFGSFCTNVGLNKKIPKNPNDITRVTGGSSGGAAGFTKLTKLPGIALAQSTGGSIVNPASFCGVTGLCPSYGLVSRYGLIDYANSLDKIGVIAKTTQEAFLMSDVIKGHDRNDSTSVKKEDKDGKVKKIAVIKESLNVDDKIKDLILAKIQDYDYEEVSLPLTEKYGIACYYLIAMAEASTNLARYCGMRYGLQLELQNNYNYFFAENRSVGFNKESKRRIILGTFARMAGYRDAYYLKAMKVRTLIINEYKKAFKRYDLLVSPTMPITAPKFEEIKKLSPLQSYMMDTLTVGPNLAGLPHLSINAGYVNKMPLGILFIGDYLKDNKLRNIK